MKEKQMLRQIEDICNNYSSNPTVGMFKIRELIASSKLNGFYKMTPGEHFSYSGVDFTFLGLRYGGALCAAAYEMDDMPFDVANNNNWKTSTIRTELYTKFLPLLRIDDLIQFDIDLSSADGDASYGTATEWCGLLTAKQWDEYKTLLPVKNSSWTCTPWSCHPLSSTYARVVLPDGEQYASMTSHSHECIPVCVFRTSDLECLCFGDDE